jgi:hypothetical protein
MAGISLFWVVFFSGATYLSAGWLREAVCMHMCPYARFQSVMFDKDTLAIAYDASRGESRGPRKRDVEPAEAGLGDCIDCHDVRAGVPDRDRHPRRLADGVHRLRRLHRCLRFGDGQNGLCPGPGAVTPPNMSCRAARPTCCGLG